MKFGCNFSIAVLAIFEFWHLSPSCSQMHTSFLLFPHFLQILLKSFFMNRAKVSPVIYRTSGTIPPHFYTQCTLSDVHTSHQFHMHSPWQLLLGPHFSSSNSNHQVQMLGHWGSACRQNYKHLGKSLPHSSNGLNIFFFKHFACKFQPPALVVL